MLAEQGLRAAVASSYQSVSYLAGTHIMTQTSVPDRLEFCVVFADGSAALLACNLETSMVRTQTDIEDIVEYVEFADVPADALAKLLRERGITDGSVGVEVHRLPADAYSRVASNLPDVALIGIDRELDALQAVKDEWEVSTLRYGAQATLDAVEGAAAVARAGTSELDFCGDITARLFQSGGPLEFLVFGAGERALQAHAEPIDRPLTEGEIWRIDLGSRFSCAVFSDLARTGVVGEPTAEQEETMAMLRATQDAGFAAIEPGRPASEVFEAVKAEFARQSLPFFMPHIGHGLGIGLHEFPMLEPQNPTPLEIGMVLNVEPMVVFADRAECYHTEDLAVVTADGRELLTKPQDALIRIGV
jgi:Xaa-Pro aminopeptidase